MPTFEIAAFTVRPEDEEALLRERPVMVAALQRAFPGALAAWLTREEDGTWLDVILWRTPMRQRRQLERSSRCRRCISG